MWSHSRRSKRGREPLVADDATIAAKTSLCNRLRPWSPPRAARDRLEQPAFQHLEQTVSLKGPLRVRGSLASSGERLRETRLALAQRGAAADRFALPVQPTLRGGAPTREADAATAILPWRNADRLA